MNKSEKAIVIMREFVNSLLSHHDMDTWNNLKPYLEESSKCLDEDTTDCFEDWINARTDLSQDQQDIVTGEGNLIDMYFMIMRTI